MPAVTASDVGSLLAAARSVDDREIKLVCLARARAALNALRAGLGPLEASIRSVQFAFTSQPAKGPMVRLERTA